MLTLEQVRAVNDGLSSGDYNAALRPLEEQIDLRYAELPRLEKPSLAALQADLSTPETAAFWAAAVFAPNISVRRFVRKTLLGLKSKAQPVAEPLQKRLEEFWVNEELLPFSNNAREAIARREQLELVQSALEILLRADADRFMVFWGQLIEVARPTKAQQAAEITRWHENQRKYSEAFRLATDDQIRAELGDEYLDNAKRVNLPSRIWREIHEAVQAQPHIKQLMEAMGNHPWANAALQWQPASMFQGAVAEYMRPDATGPQREVAERVRVHLWRLIDAAFDSHSTNAQREAARFQLNDIAPYYYLGQWLGQEEIWAKVPTLLQSSRPSLLDALRGFFKKQQQGRVAVPGSSEALWAALAQALAQACIRRHNVKEEDWHIPASITPELLRSFKVSSDSSHWGASQALESAAKQLEQARAVKTPEDTQPTPKSTTLNVSSHVPELDASLQGLYPSPEEYAALQEESQQTKVHIGTLLANRRLAVQRDIEAVTNLDEKVERLLEPSALLGKVAVSRLPYWNIWAKNMGQQAIKEQLWPRVAPKLWARYEAKLDSYRRVETEEIEPKLGEKLKAHELKEWKANQRAQKRYQVQHELNDIAALLRLVGGMQADLKLLELLNRPGLKDLLRAQQVQLLHQAGNIYYFNQTAESRQQGSDPNWLRENWFLGAEWAPIIEQLEQQLLNGKKINEWEKANLERQFAIAYYRLNTPTARSRFDELAAHTSNLAAGLTQVVTALKDVDAWLLLVNNLDWPHPDLRNLWTQTRQQSPEDANAIAEKVLGLLSTSSNEKAAKFQIELVNELSPEELAAHTEAIVAALESSLIVVKRWALATLYKLPEAELDWAYAAQLSNEMLWNENGALVKDAIKLLGAQTGEAASIAFEGLQDALSLENQTILETILRALSSLKTKHKELELNEMSVERINQLTELAPDRFGKFRKKLQVAA